MARKLIKKKVPITKSSASQFKITPTTTHRGLQSMRLLAQPKNIRLFQDQLELVALLEKKLGRQINMPDVIRDGLDLILKDIMDRFNVEIKEK
jgi:hypothetical protein